jgi:hypothetical protein
LTIRPVAVLPLVDAAAWPAARIRYRIDVGAASRDALRLPTRAATPVTCGAAIEVPADQA